uniref:Acetylglutamate kinase n=1 Tax=Halydictyon mirabile TaxID=189652 RepID=A0A4D6WUS6_9FLOR|nr:acetylglutamate kinase [Halydictyon mirabile]
MPNYNQFSFINNLLPFIQQYRDSILVIKYGGSVMHNSTLQKKVIDDISFLYLLGIKIVLVHGGGPFINDWFSKLNIVPRFVNGIRITDSSTIEIVEMVLSANVNKKLVSLFNTNHIPAIGLSGKDANLVVSSSLYDSIDNFVGKVDKVNSNILNVLLENNYIPIISSVSFGKNGQTYNINADTVASSIAQSLCAKKLVLLTDSLGIMLDINDKSTLLESLTINDIYKLKDDFIISNGMIPKVDCCIEALLSGIESTHIIDGKIEHAILYELLTTTRIGSMITL